MTGPSGAVTSTSDAYGQQGAQGSQSSTYDALGRDVGVAVTSGATTTLSYEGTTGQLASDGAASYTWTPGGTLTGTANSPGTGALNFTDLHTDVTGQFIATGTTLAGSRTFGPWGATITTGGTLAGSLGYQSQYTSPATGQVDMGARWYNPATGSFGNKDTVANKPVPDSASASPFGYAADNPLGATDPTGHQVDPPESAATAKALAAEAHAAHLAHLAHLAVLAKQAPAVKAAAAKITPSCATSLTGANLSACMQNVYSAAGGTSYSESIAKQAITVVAKQHAAAVKTAAAVNTAAAKIPTSCVTGLSGSNLSDCTQNVYSASGGRPNGTGYNASIATQALEVIKNQHNADLKVAQSSDNPVSINNPQLPDPVKRHVPANLYNGIAITDYVMALQALNGYLKENGNGNINGGLVNKDFTVIISRVQVSTSEGPLTRIVAYVSGSGLPKELEEKLDEYGVKIYEADPSLPRPLGDAEFLARDYRDAVDVQQEDLGGPITEVGDTIMNNGACSGPAPKPSRIILAVRAWSYRRVAAALWAIQFSTRARCQDFAGNSPEAVTLRRSSVTSRAGGLSLLIRKRKSREGMGLRKRKSREGMGREEGDP